VCGPLLNTDLIAVASEALERDATSVMIGLGVTVTLVVTYLHWRRHGADPFRGAEVRSSRITATLALLPACGFLLASALFVAAHRRLVGTDLTEAARLGINSLAQAVGAVCCLWVAARYFRGGVGRFLCPRRRLAGQLGAALIYLMAAEALCELTAQGTQWLFLLFDPDYVLVEHAVIEALRDPTEPAWAPLVLWIGAVLIAPVAEECFFRGMLATMLLRTVRMRWVAVLAPSVLFGLAHANQPHVIPALTLFGIILGIQYERCGSLAGPIALHALFNLKTLIWQWCVVGV